MRWGFGLGDLWRRFAGARKEQARAQRTDIFASRAGCDVQEFSDPLCKVQPQPPWPHAPREWQKSQQSTESEEVHEAMRSCQALREHLDCFDSERSFQFPALRQDIEESSTKRPSQVVLPGVPQAMFPVFRHLDHSEESDDQSAVPGRSRSLSPGVQQAMYHFPALPDNSHESDADSAAPGRSQALSAGVQQAMHLRHWPELLELSDESDADSAAPRRSRSLSPRVQQAMRQFAALLDHSDESDADSAAPGRSPAPTRNYGTVPHEARNDESQDYAGCRDAAKAVQVKRWPSKGKANPEVSG